MRTRIFVLIGALLLASASYGAAQDSTQTALTPSTQTATTSSTQTTAATKPADVPAAVAPKLGTVDFGFRGTNIDGDSARYYRFKDWRDGGFVERFRFEKVTDNSLWHAEANNVGYRDQRYFAEYQSIGKIKANAEWNEIPLYISKDTETLYTVSKSGLFTIDDNIQKGIEAGTTTIANAINQVVPFEARTQRDTALFNLTYTATRDVDLKFSVRNSRRDGYNLQSLNFGFSNTIESEVPSTIERPTSKPRWSSPTRRAAERRLQRVLVQTTRSRCTGSTIRFATPTSSAHRRSGRCRPGRATTCRP